MKRFLLSCVLVVPLFVGGCEAMSDPERRAVVVGDVFELVTTALKLFDEVSK